MGGRHDNRVVFFDQTEPTLSVFWRASDLIDGTRHHFGVRSWRHLLNILNELRHDLHDIEELQFMGHGTTAGPMIDGVYPTIQELEEFKVAAPNLHTVWFRNCDVARKPQKMKFLLRHLGVQMVAAHREVVAAGRERYAKWIPFIGGKRKMKFWFQGSLVCYCKWQLDQGIDPPWDVKTPFDKGVSTTQFTIPDWAIPKRIPAKPRRILT